jgi:phospholipid/cholesterol/gamma-HCH transport system permease protein
MNGILESVGRITLLFVETLKNIFAGKTSSRLTFDQLVRIGVDSLPVALVTALFVGMVFAIQIANEFVKFGAGNVVGGVMAIAVARELAPALTGIVVAGRVGAAMAAEIGTMKVTEQVDALLTLGSHPVKYLVVPRTIACAVMFPFLTVLSNIVGFYGGYFVATVFVKINGGAYLDSASSLIKISDVFGGLAKAVVFGILVALISCYQGLHAKNGAKGVGEATTNAVVYSLISIFIFNYFLSVAFFR